MQYEPSLNGLLVGCTHPKKKPRSTDRGGSRGFVVLLGGTDLTNPKTPSSPGRLGRGEERVAGLPARNASGVSESLSLVQIGSYAAVRSRVNGQAWTLASAAAQLACGAELPISPQRLSRIHASRRSTPARKVDDAQ